VYTEKAARGALKLAEEVVAVVEGELGLHESG
jgi:hypothetical protein